MHTFVHSPFGIGAVRTRQPSWWRTRQREARKHLIQTGTNSFLEDFGWVNVRLGRGYLSRN
jgi:hypothetical protein